MPGGGRYNRTPAKPLAEFTRRELAAAMVANLLVQGAPAGVAFWIAFGKGSDGYSERKHIAAIVIGVALAWSTIHMLVRFGRSWLRCKAVQT
jgi:hypothetical protein